ncbi:MAG: Glycosyl transferase group 1 [Microgenomates group bacterium GW2011_GWC1_37_8]|uniref:Glycosyl transferase group 1 n=1 Tax=Candidatus Woesebacteria bacterium GW2011_GWB1_38_8 TaxID=1618570 RepID=A0A0G0P756_9BACT|nr:MAG: Glycosyl transferase group 1 [Microgenomates group bacterium GW2011_GWC1_37_8]KKQ85101.1 MAG: Glycosyl transferase group 1 [Candidatus Woesebacteria bacterium GW2011_GWB1_38_8]
MNIIILGYRVAGLDGVSLETVHWKNILERMGHKVTLVAGELDREGILIPELHFKSPTVAGIHHRVVYGNESYEKIERAIFDIAGTIEGRLRQLFRNGTKPDLLITPNVFSIPMHFPLAVALTRTIDEFEIKTIARHHDFWWERERYNKSHMFKFFEKWFPPKSDLIKHTVINSIARKSLKDHSGIEAEVIWDTFDFDNSDLGEIDSYSKHFRSDFDLDEKDIVFLQATRVLPRKRIEISIELMRKMNLPNAILIVAGTEGDEQKGYLKKLRVQAKESGIRCKFIGERVNSQRKIISGKRTYSLWDCYVNCDFVTYPTKKEGFGNQFVETMFFKKPIILTPYPVYEKDIRPLGFEVIEMTENITDATLKQLRKIMVNPSEKQKMVEKNFDLGKKYFSYEWVENKLQKIIEEIKLS